MYQSETISDDQKSRQDSLDPNSFKIVLVGPSGSGKTSIIQQFILENSSDPKSTNCYEIHHKKLKIDDKEYSINFWDCGAYHYQSYHGVKKAFYRSALCALIVLDCSNFEYSKSVVDDWISECYEYDIYQVIVILNKLDTLDPNYNSIDGPSLNKNSNSQSIQLTSGIISKEQFDSIKEINDFFQEKNIRFYLGSVKKTHQKAIQYSDLLIQLIRENTVNYSNQKHESDKILASQFKRKLADSIVRYSVALPNRNSTYAYAYNNNNNNNSNYKDKDKDQGEKGKIQQQCILF